MQIVGLQHAVVAGAAAFGGAAGDDVGLLLERAAVVGHEPDAAAQVADLLHAGRGQQFGERVGHEVGSRRCMLMAVTTAATMTRMPTVTTADWCSSTKLESLLCQSSALATTVPPVPSVRLLYQYQHK